MSNFERENPNLVIKIDNEPDNRTRLVRKAFRLKQQPRAYKNSSNKTKPTIMQKELIKNAEGKRLGMRMILSGGERSFVFSPILPHGRSQWEEKAHGLSCLSQLLNLSHFP